MLPSFLKKYFWDVDFTALKQKKYEQFIAKRILERGDVKAVRWLLKNIPEKAIKETVLSCRQLSSKTANFWAGFFGLNRKKILCLKKSFQKLQKSHWIN